MAAVVEVRDYVLWLKHLHGDPMLRDELLAIPADTVVDLIVDGKSGTWVKMRDGHAGAATPGLKALGAARQHWHGLFRTRRGTVVDVIKAPSMDRQ